MIERISFSLIGWVLFVATVVLYWRLWKSTDATRIRELKDENERAQRTIADLRKIENSLSALNSDLVLKVNSLFDDNRKLKAAMDTLRQVNELQSQTIDRMDKYQREQAGKIEWLVGRVIQLDAERGIDTKLPWTQ